MDNLDELIVHATEDWVREHFYTRENIDTKFEDKKADGDYVVSELNRKINSFDIIHDYNFKGNVATVDDLPEKYKIIPCGAPYVIEDGVKR